MPRRPFYSWGEVMPAEPGNGHTVRWGRGVAMASPLFMLYHAEAMAGPLVVDLEVYRGDTWTQLFRFTANGEPVNLTGITLASECRSQLGEAYPMPVTVVGDPAEGTVALSVGDWDEVPPGTHSYDIEATDSAGTVTTWVRGRMKVLRDVTNEIPLHDHDGYPTAAR